jgi:hypothetical protein
MKAFVCLIGVIIESVASVWIWPKWVNRPMNDLHRIPLQSMGNQAEYIRKNYPYRLVRGFSTSSSDIFRRWATDEANRRSVVLIVIWLATAIVSAFLYFRNSTVAG